MNIPLDLRGWWSCGPEILPSLRGQAGRQLARTGVVCKNRTKNTRFSLASPTAPSSCSERFIVSLSIDQTCLSRDSAATTPVEQLPLWKPTGTPQPFLITLRVPRGVLLCSRGRRGSPWGGRSFRGALCGLWQGLWGALLDPCSGFSPTSSCLCTGSSAQRSSSAPPFPEDAHMAVNTKLKGLLRETFPDLPSLGYHCARVPPLSHSLGPSCVSVIAQTSRHRHHLSPPDLEPLGDRDHILAPWQPECLARGRRSGNIYFR